MIRFIALSFGLAASVAQAETTDLAAKLRGESLRTISLGAAGMIDGYPLWSADSSEIAFNIGDKWIAVAIDSFAFSKADWSHTEIAAIKDASHRLITVAEVAAFIGPSDPSSRTISLKDSTKISMPETDLGSAMRIHPLDGAGQKIFQTDMDNCFAPTPSPDEIFVAFLCDGAGLFLTLVK